MDLGDHMTVADLKLTANMTVLAEPEETVAVIHVPRSVTLAEEQAAAEAPAAE